MTHRQLLRIQRFGLIHRMSEWVTWENDNFTPRVGLNSTNWDMIFVDTKRVGVVRLQKILLAFIFIIASKNIEKDKQKDSPSFVWYIHCSLENRCYWLTSAEWREHLQISRRPVSFYPGASYLGPRWCRLRQVGSSWQCQGEASVQQSNFADLFVVFKALEARGQCMKEWIWSIVSGCASICLRAKAGTFPIHFSKSMYGYKWLCPHIPWAVSAHLVTWSFWLSAALLFKRFTQLLKLGSDWSVTTLGGCATSLKIAEKIIDTSKSVSGGDRDWWGGLQTDWRMGYIVHDL